MAAEPVLSALAEQLRAGGPVALDKILGWQYRGTSLGLPSWVEALTWKTFIKVFHRDALGEDRGWNVRCHQDDGRPKVVRGVPVTFGHFAVLPCPSGYDVPAGAALLRYHNLLRDPLVALDDRCDTLLGCTLLEVGGRIVPTPSYFRLERLRPVDHVVYPG